VNKKKNFSIFWTALLPQQTYSTCQGSSMFLIFIKELEEGDEKRRNYRKRSWVGLISFLI